MTVLGRQISLFCLLLLKNSNFIQAGEGIESAPTLDDNGEEVNCEIWVKGGECNLNPTYMLEYCRQECFDDDKFTTVGYFQEEEEDDDNNPVNQLACYDIHEEEKDLKSCDEFAKEGECAVDPAFMLFKCAKSCLVCTEPGQPQTIQKNTAAALVIHVREKTFPIGKKQEIHPDDLGDEDAIENTVEVITNTYAYMQNIMTQPEYASIRKLCQNNDEFCAALAADGACEMPENFDELPEDDNASELYVFMSNECAPACQSCEEFLVEDEGFIVKDCVPDPKTNIFKPGDLNRMFERIVGETSEGYVVVPKEDVHVLSRPTHPKGFKGKDEDPTDYVLGPWVVTLSNFLTDEECDRLIQFGSRLGYDRSTLEEAKNYDEDEKAAEKDGEDAYRTSTNTWCEDECYEDTMVRHVIDKLSNATGIPDSYSESLQLLSYIPGQYYKDHHDWITDGPFQPPGPRMVTFFLYLNDVEQGGATRMTDLTGDDGGIFLDVQPKKGMALVWPSVLDEDPMRIDVRTYHEALTVLKGRKFGANAWFHLRQYKDEKCDYDALDQIGEETEESEESSSLSDEL